MDGNWDDLRVFLAVARTQSLSRAGKLLRVDPATVGRRIARLEERLQVTLFAKSPQGYALLDEGQRLLEHAVQAETAMQTAGEALAGQGGFSGQIRIGAPDGAANFLLPQVCAGLSDAYPDLDIQIVALPRVLNLSRREADMAVTVSAPTAGRLLVQKITDYRLHLAASDTYLAQHAPIRSRADLGAHRLVGYIPDMIFDAELDYLGELGATRVPLASNSVSVQLNWIRQGGGIGIVHDFSLSTFPGLRRVLSDQISLRRAFYLVRHEGDQHSARLNRFASRLSEALRAEVARLEGCAANSPS